MSLFTSEEQELIASAIADAEKTTSGEIRIAIEKHCHGSAFERATQYFAELGMDKTAQHNGVLIYLASTDHKLQLLAIEE